MKEEVVKYLVTCKNLNQRGIILSFLNSLGFVLYTQDEPSTRNIFLNLYICDCHGLVTICNFSTDILGKKVITFKSFYKKFNLKNIKLPKFYQPKWKKINWEY